jgi:hypothetical protein
MESAAANERACSMREQFRTVSAVRRIASVPLRWRFVLLPLLLLACSCAPEASDVVATGLRCESRVDPMGIDSPAPRLSWRLEARNSKLENGNEGTAPRGVKQVAYQILVATSEDLLKEGPSTGLGASKADLWDSGKVESDQSIHVEYEGEPLESQMRCYWKVKVWTVTEPRPLNPDPSAWSAPARWTMGLMKPEDWLAKWITASRWFTEPRFRPPGWIAVGAPSWAQVDLGRPVRIDSIRLHPHTPGVPDCGSRSRRMMTSISIILPSWPTVPARMFTSATSRWWSSPGKGITARRVRIW